MKQKRKRILATGDWHCGHQVGLTPPEYQAPMIDDERQAKYLNVRREVWKYFAATVRKYQPIDILLVNGDSLEGKGERSGSTELISSDRTVQCKIAQKVIEFIDPKKIRMTYGTPSHTGTDEDWEDIIAEAVGAKIGSHEWYDINGIIIDMKHKIGSSNIPHGRLTPLAREVLWQKIWASRQQVPEADIILRSHVHYYEEIYHDGCRAFTLPAMQGFGSKFGSRQCSGTVDIGFVIFDIDEKGEYTWKPEKVLGTTQVARAERL